MGKFIDLTGRKFGKLVVIEKSKPYQKRQNSHAYYRCRCDCGNEKIIDGTKLQNGHTQSCGCLRNKDYTERYNFIDLTGQRFGRLQVLKVAQNKNKRLYWLCLCDCGKRKVIEGGALKSGRTISCGCRRKDFRKGLDSLINRVYSQYRSSAKKRNKEFSLNKDEFWKMTQRPCFYCGAEKMNTVKNYNNIEDNVGYNGIDRIDSQKGYTIDNVVPCCGRCNEAKMDIPQNEFISWIERVYNNLKNKKAGKKSEII